MIDSCCDNPVVENKEHYMKVQVDKKRCVGDKVCTEICPEIFIMDGGVASVKLKKVPERLAVRCRDAEESCPAFAIIIKNN